VKITRHSREFHALFYLSFQKLNKNHESYLGMRYVQATCNGDHTILLGSGFPTHKPRSPIGVLSVPTRLQLSLGFLSGELDASVAPVFGALMYNWRLTTAAQPDVVAQTKQTSAANVQFTGLTPGVIYKLQANAVGTAGPGSWIGPIPKMVV
jgi:hypothetical protein